MPDDECTPPDCAVGTAARRSRPVLSLAARTFPQHCLSKATGIRARALLARGVRMSKSWSPRITCSFCRLRSNSCPRRAQLPSRYRRDARGPFELSLFPRHLASVARKRASPRAPRLDPEQPRSCPALLYTSGRKFRAGQKTSCSITAASVAVHRVLC